jgi:hypothetical protein
MIGGASDLGIDVLARGELGALLQQVFVDDRLHGGHGQGLGPFTGYLPPLNLNYCPALPDACPKTLLPDTI